MSDIKSIAQIKQEFEQSGDDKEALYVQYAGDSVSYTHLTLPTTERV